MHNIFIGIDNGVSGSIGYLCQTETGIKGRGYFRTPIKREQDYTQKKKIITRIDVDKFKALFEDKLLAGKGTDFQEHILIERPMVNPTRFVATASALRALEATLVILEDLGLGFEFTDSKEWQKVMLPKGVKGSTELKKASKDIGKRLFPEFEDIIKKQGDADGILMAEYCRRKHLGLLK